MPSSAPNFLTRARRKLLGSRTPFESPKIVKFGQEFYFQHQAIVKDQTSILSKSTFIGRDDAQTSVFDIDVKNSIALDAIDLPLLGAPDITLLFNQPQRSVTSFGTIKGRSLVGRDSHFPLKHQRDDEQQNSVLVENAPDQLASDSLELQLPLIEGKVYVDQSDDQDEVEGPNQTAARMDGATLFSNKAGGSAPSPLSGVFDDLYYLLLPPEESLHRVPLLFQEGQSCYPFQWDGIKFLVEHEQGLLADEMGLGKSIQAIVALRILFRLGRVKNALIVSPKSVLSDWEDKLISWASELRVVRVQGDKVTRKMLWRAPVHVFLINYETLKLDLKDKSVAPNFDIVVLDEIQRIKNPNTGITKAARMLSSPYRWGLSGTPLENKIDEIVSVFNFIKPGLFRPGDPMSPRNVRQRIRPYILRRRKADALKLPDKVIDEVWLDLTPNQRASYQKAEKEGVVELNKFGDTVTVTHVLALITKLKQICNVDLASGQSCKVDYLKDQLPQAVAKNDKVLIFSQYPEKTLAVVGPMLQEFNPSYYTGAMSERKRAEMVREFQGGDQCNVLLMSIKAGGLGLTLTRARYVFHFDLWWNPATATQAEDRAHRIGQTKTVFVNYLYSRNTIEERIYRMLKTKRALFNQVVDDLSDSHLEKAITREELFSLFDLNVRAN